MIRNRPPIPGGRFFAGNGRIFAQKISVRRAGNARPLALPMGELARLKAVTERVPGCNHGTYSKLATANALSGSLRSPAPPKGEPRAAAPPDSHVLTPPALGGCAAVLSPSYPLRRAGAARPLALPMGELARLKAVTERVPSYNYRIFSYLQLQTPSQSRYARHLPQRGSQGRLRRQRHQPLTTEPGDPQRCVFTARVAGSSLPAGAYPQKNPNFPLDFSGKVCYNEV